MADQSRGGQGWKRADIPSQKLNSPIAIPDLPPTPAAPQVPGRDQDDDSETEGGRVTNEGNKDEGKTKKKSKEKVEKVKKEKEPREKNEREKEEKGSKKEKEKEEKEKPDKAKKRNEKEVPEKPDDKKIVVPKKNFKKIKEIIDKGLQEHDKKRNKGRDYTIDFLTALSDTLKYYDADHEDHTEFVTRFREAWKEQHASVGSLDMADIVQELSTADYQVLKDFHDAPCAASNKKAEKGSKEKVKKGKEAEEGSKDKVRKGKDAKKEETEEAENEEVKKGRKDKGKKAKEKKEPEEVEKEEPEEAEVVDIVIPEMVVMRIKDIIFNGLDDQHENNGNRSVHTVEFLSALADSLDDYDAAKRDQTEFVISFHDAWEKKHTKCGNLAAILQRNKAVNYMELKHFHDAFWDATKDKLKFTDLSWKGAKGQVTSVKSEKNVEPTMRMGGTRNNNSTRDEESRNKKSTRDEESRNKKSPRDEESRNKKSPRDEESRNKKSPRD